MMNSDPNTYQFLTDGVCLGSFVGHGTICEAETTRQIEVGNVVAVTLKREGSFERLAANLADSNMHGVTKIYLGRETTADGDTVHMVGMINPPTVVPLPVGSIEAMHVVTSFASTDPDHVVTEADKQTWRLLTPFLRKQAPEAPVNPSWRPSGTDPAAFSLGVLETAAGPSIGTAADLIELLLKTRDSMAGKVTGEEAKAPYADALNFALHNNPVFHANLFYVRPALDFLFLDSMREAISPGYQRRLAKRRRKDYGQAKAVKSLDPLK